VNLSPFNPAFFQEGGTRRSSPGLSAQGESLPTRKHATALAIIDGTMMRQASMRAIYTTRGAVSLLPLSDLPRRVYGSKKPPVRGRPAGRGRKRNEGQTLCIGHWPLVLIIGVANQWTNSKRPNKPIRENILYVPSSRTKSLRLPVAPTEESCREGRRQFR